jgi:DNA-binding transcriptional LysR family regulator
VPYFGTALECIPQTNLVLTGTSSAARAAEMHSDLRVIEAPPELTGFSFQQVWHPRLNTDSAHRWLRQEMLRVAQQIKL